MNLRAIFQSPSLVLGMVLLIHLCPVSAETSVSLAKLEEGLKSVDKRSSSARQRLAVRRAIRDAEKEIKVVGDKVDRWALLEFLFRARQRLVSLDNDKEHRVALLSVCKELVKAPKEFAKYRLEADFLLSQVKVAQVAKLGGQGDLKAARASTLKNFVDGYIGTPVVAKALRMTAVLAIELGDERLIADLNKKIAIHCASDHEMISFQRDHFGGQVFGAPFAGRFKRSDGKVVHFPMDGYGRSFVVLFWSKEGEGLEYARGMAEAAKIAKEEKKLNAEIISMNLDDLPDAGESIIRGFGVDWQCFHLPGGRKNSVYKAYARRDPLRVKLSSTGQAALVMAGLERVRLKEDGSLDYGRTLGFGSVSPWMLSSYCAQLCSLSAGDFLIFDSSNKFDPALPPELKVTGAVEPIVRSEGSVPDDVLLAIQKCFVAPATCYQSSLEEMSGNYRQAVELSRKAIEAHPKAANLWVVRNRLIVALMGLWRTDAKLTHLEQAFVEAKAAVDAGYPDGCDLVARFCLARQGLRDEGANTADVIDTLIEQLGGEKASGQVHAVASLLALDVADRARFERSKEIILKKHTEDPMMWVYTSSLLDRHHDYWRFQMPFYIGYSYPKREIVSKDRGEVEQAQRMLKAELHTAEGKVFRIPEDLTASYTAIFFSKPEPWAGKHNKTLPASPIRMVSDFSSKTAGRSKGNVQTILAMLGDSPHKGAIKDRRGKEIKIACSMMALPGGEENPLVHRLGMLFGKGGINLERLQVMLLGVINPILAVPMQPRD